jgi:hypothetical protein
MGCGSPEFLLLFFKLPTDRSNGYADEPVTKDADEYSLARWQIDADALWRSSGDRPLTAEELALFPPDALARLFPAWSIQDVYDHEAHVEIGEGLGGSPGAAQDLLGPEARHAFAMTSGPTSRGCGRSTASSPAALENTSARCSSISWTAHPALLEPGRAGARSVRRARDRADARTVKLGRRGYGVELDPKSYADAVHYCREAEAERATPSLEGERCGSPHALALRLHA